MEACISCLNAPHLPQIPTFISRPGNHRASGYRRLNLRQSFRRQKGVRVECGGGDRKMRPLSKGKEKITEEKWEEESEEDVDEEVELMEMEAIMGEDDGKEPMDYKRRAGIFYKSSEMFQAIKDKEHHHCA